MAHRLIACALVLAAAGAAHAHHSIAGYFDSSRQVTIDGVVAEFQFIQPHPFLIVDVTSGRTAERWRLEMDNRWELTAIGFTETTLRPGDRVVVRGSMARREPREMYIERLDRPADGFGYEQVGNRPQARPRAR
jgi:hypothetical protein